MGEFIKYFSGKNICIDDTEQLIGYPAWITEEQPEFLHGEYSMTTYWAIYKHHGWKEKILWRCIDDNST
jgi:hypothetical protein